MKLSWNGPNPMTSLLRGAFLYSDHILVKYQFSEKDVLPENWIKMGKAMIDLLRLVEAPEAPF